MQARLGAFAPLAALQLSRYACRFGFGGDGHGAR
jgi:hypothetical protein